MTQAIPYVNAQPHIGQALEFIQTDCIHRFKKLQGFDTLYLCGSDENALKNVKSAENLGITPQQICDRNTEKFKKLVKELDISIDIWQRGSDRKLHWPGTHKLWELCEKSGDIYKKKYKGLYCVGCEVFYTENELVNGLCLEHQKEPELVEEENYFFRLSKYQKKLEELIENDVIKVVPKTRKNEVLSFIRSGLEDFSISRSVKRARGWGVLVPSDPTQIVYVWFDALNIYQTGIGFGWDEKKYNKWWPADLHVIGKGITRFHAVYWPAMLLSAGLSLPKAIFVHGYITVEGQKMSKTIGNVVNPLDVLKKFSKDELRYFLLRNVPVFDDGDFSEKTLVERVNNELVENYSNLFYRITSFIEKNFKGKVPKFGKEGEKEKEIKKIFKERVGNYVKAFEDYRLNDTLAVAMDLSSQLNKYFQDKQPWITVKNDASDCATTLYTSVNLLKIISTLLYPFIPSSSEDALVCLGLKVDWSNVDTDIKSEAKIKSKMLFKKIEDKVIQKPIRTVNFFIEPEVEKLGIQARAVIIRGVDIKNRNSKLEKLRKEVIQKTRETDLNNLITNGYRDLYKKLKVKGESPGEFFTNFVRKKRKST